MSYSTQTSAFYVLEKITVLGLQKLGQKFLTARQNLLLVEEKINVLADFQKDYLLRAEIDCRAGINNQQYQNYQYFLTSLEHSIVGQMDTAHQYKNEIEMLGRQLNTLQQKKILYEKILLRQRTRQITELNKKEQKMTDSYSKVSQSKSNNKLTN